MAGDGGRAPGVSEQRADYDAGIEAAEAAFMKRWGRGVRLRERLEQAIAAYLSHADPASVLAALLDERSRIRIAEVILDRVCDARGDDEAEGLRIALKRIAYGLEGEMGRYDAPRDDTWWGRIALEALARSPQGEDHEADRMCFHATDEKPICDACAVELRARALAALLARTNVRLRTCMASTRRWATT